MSVDCASAVPLQLPPGPSAIVCPPDVTRMFPKVDALSAPKEMFIAPAPASASASSVIANCWTKIPPGPGRRTRSCSVCAAAL